MKSLVAKRSIAIGGHKTSVTLEEAFWNGLKEVASNRNLTLSELVTAIDSERPNANLSSAIRLFVLDHYRTMIGSAADTRNSHVEMPAKNPSALHSTGEPR
jgi:predicted DNA-binding ribbon-helix-helix protein